jgi:aspartyl-tRNA(Asn)/glutamyl-tRNA(Gln) amidotransferase subunit B
MLDFDNILIAPENFAELISLIGENKINSRMAKNILKKMAEKGGGPSLIMEDMKWKQIDDEEAINDFVKQVINENPSAVEDYKNGKETALQFLIGQAMKKSKSGLNPINLSKIFKKNINL